MKRFILILQFLTRITIIKDLPYDKDFKKGIIYFPVVGLVLGFLLALVYKGLFYLFPVTISSILITGIYVALTGGLHLDGLGDTFDGFYSSRTKDRILEIMKDSRLGTNGVIVIIISLLLRVFGIAAISQEKVMMALIYMPVVGRLAIVYGSFGGNYARQEGLGNIFIGKVTIKEMLIATIITCLMMIPAWPYMTFIPVLWLFSSFFKNHSNKIISGMTGDTLGALCELTEVFYILYFLALNKIMM